jgi:hypothetical protein
MTSLVQWTGEAGQKSAAPPGTSPALSSVHLRDAGRRALKLLVRENAEYAIRIAGPEAGIGDRPPRVQQQACRVDRR